MPWAKVGDEWWCHPKVMGLGLAPRGLWVSALSWSCAQRKDTVPERFLAMCGGTPEDAAALVEVGLWVAVEGGWRIHDWAEYQERTVKEKRADAGRKGGIASGEARRSKAKQNDALTSSDAPEGRSNAEADAEAGPIPSQPFPSKTAPDPWRRPRLQPVAPVQDVDRSSGGGNGRAAVAEWRGREAGGQA